MTRKYCRAILFLARVGLSGTGFRVSAVGNQKSHISGSERQIGEKKSNFFIFFDFFFSPPIRFMGRLRAV
jgi:hypothetical protein